MTHAIFDTLEEEHSGRSTALGSQEAFESGLIFNNKSRTFYLHQLSHLKITKYPRYGLPGGTDHLGDFLVRKRERDLYFTFSIFLVSGQIQQKSSQLLADGMREPNRSHFRDC